MKKIIFKLCYSLTVISAISLLIHLFMLVLSVHQYILLDSASLGIEMSILGLGAGIIGMQLTEM